jgi:hypothetical protein
MKRYAKKLNEKISISPANPKKKLFFLTGGARRLWKLSFNIAVTHYR